LTLRSEAGLPSSCPGKTGDPGRLGWDNLPVYNGVLWVLALVGSLARLARALWQMEDFCTSGLHALGEGGRLERRVFLNI